MPDRVDSRRGPGPRRPVQPGHRPAGRTCASGRRPPRTPGTARCGRSTTWPAPCCAATRCSRPSPCSARWPRRRRRSSSARWSPTCNHRTPALLAVAAATLEAIADRQVHVGLGAGAAPDSRWSAEMRAIGQPVAATVGRAPRAGRRRRSTCSTAMFDPGRDDALATFPLPRRRPTVLLGVNGPSLASPGRAARRRRQRRLGPPATRRAVRRRPRRTGASGAGFVLTTWTPWAPELLDPDHPTRRAMADLDRVVLVVPGTSTPPSSPRPCRGESTPVAVGAARPVAGAVVGRTFRP